MMLPGRSNETKYLDNIYSREGSQILVVYGREGVGKTSLIMDFVKDKEFDYFLSRECSESEQLKFFSDEINLRYNFSAETKTAANYESIFKAVTMVHCRKKILVIDEFQNFVRNSDDFMDNVVSLIHDRWNNQPVLVILCSSSFSWVENDMVSQIGKNAYELSGFLKIKELGFLDLVRRFPKYSITESVGVYSVLGGVPGLWKYFSGNISLKENICRTILKKGTVLHNRAYSEITEKLREPSVYQTILSRMAIGEDKLNDLFKSTGYNRAKISVYLKNLMELEIVEKIYSEDTEGRENARKGIYRIKNHLIYFWFKFVFPNLSMLEALSEEDFFDRFVAEGLREFEADFYKDVCREFMELMAAGKQLPLEVSSFGSWSGKVGDIDIVGKSENRKYIIGLCSWEKDIVTYDDYEWLLFCAKQAKIKSEHIYLFTGNTFDDRLKELQKSDASIHLIEPSML